ncbi:MAG TPA: hypothetical protein VGV38_13805 [Pyrinomonadaceae bacterium]|nr:hypothetical protein [Pyrinomonadaceae bacterium]
MNHPEDTRRGLGNPGECGASRLNLVVVLALLAAVAYVGYQYVPVAYRGSTYKVFMQDTVDRAAATGQTPAWVEKQLKAGAEEYGVPADAVYKAEMREERMRASVRFTRPVVLPGYTYEYAFDHTVTSDSFLAEPK